MVEARRRHPQLSEDAADYVRSMIVAGQLQPGDTVKAESIAEALDISATPVREALQALKVEGFLELLPRRGFQVAPLTGEDIRDILEVDALLEGELAARAATRATPEELAELEALHLELLAAAQRGDLVALEAKNDAFHGQISRIARSRKFAWVLSLVTGHTPPGFYGMVEGWAEVTAEDHSAILKSLQERDAVAARAAMYWHISHAGELLAKQFEARAGSDDVAARGLATRATARTG